MKTFKQFISISLLALTATLRANACSGPDVLNYYMFSAYNRETWGDRCARLCDSNWLTYLGKPDNKWYYFDPDEVKAFAKKKGDQLMVSYVEQLEKYLRCVSIAKPDSWNYPTKEEKAANRQRLNAIRTYAQGKLNTRLRSQFALLLMRCNMMLARHQDNVSFWQQTAQKLQNSVYRDMMKNIYAGALLNTGQRDKAIALFVEMGDTESLITYYYKKRSCQAITQEYQRNPNSPALPFLVQDFVNNAQEAQDARDEYNYWPGKLFIRDIRQAESRQMRQLCQQVVRQGKTKEPALWQSAKAWLEFLDGDTAMARATIDRAVTMAGSDRICDNARALRLYITAANNAKGNIDNYLAQELQWLEQKAEEEKTLDPTFGNHYTEVLHRLVYAVLEPRYQRLGQTEVATAIVAAENEMHQLRVYDDLAGARSLSGSDEDFKWNPDYNDRLFRRLDTMRIDRLQRYIGYISQKNAQSPLQQWLNTHLRHDDSFFTELLGTKYLRLAKWQEAKRYLERVPIRFVDTQNITPYLLQRSVASEPWLTSQSKREEQTMPGKLKAKDNPKLEFAREMALLEAGYQLLSNEERQKRAYDLAVRYFQASYLGECWSLTRYAQSCLDTLRANEADLAGHAIELLNEAKHSTNLKLQEKALFALAFIPIDVWQKEEWDDKAVDFVKQPRTSSRQYKALTELAAFIKANPTEVSPYVRKCDVIKQFEKQN